MLFHLSSRGYHLISRASSHIGLTHHSVSVDAGALYSTNPNNAAMSLAAYARFYFDAALAVGYFIHIIPALTTLSISGVGVAKPRLTAPPSLPRRLPLPLQRQHYARSYSHIFMNHSCSY